MHTSIYLIVYSHIYYLLITLLCSLCREDGQDTMNEENKEELEKFLLETFDQVYLPGFLVRNFFQNYITTR